MRGDRFVLLLAKAAYTMGTTGFLCAMKPCRLLVFQPF
jgi:hypothetical protein